MKRGSETVEIALIFLYQESNNSLYIIGQVFYINEGEYKG